MALIDKGIEYIREQYEEKNEVLSAFAEQVNSTTFYEDIFRSLDLVVPVTIISEEVGKKIQPMTVDKALNFAQCRNDILLGGCSYFNQWISKRTARDVYTLIVDYDNAYSGILQNALRNDWRNDIGEQYAKPTYIVNSGTGLHLYFVFTEPIPCYHKQLGQLDMLYRRLAEQQMTRHYVLEQIQWFGQDFRMVGGKGKNGWENVAFRYGPKWDIDELAAFYGMDFHFIRNGEQRSPSKTASRRKRPHRQGWRSNRAFYDYSVASCKKKTKEGNRYLSMCALAVIAWKCNVSLEEVKRDLYELLPIYNEGAKRIVKEQEIISALKMYNEKAMQTPRGSLERWLGWEYKPIKRNGRKRAQHLQLARGIREVKFRMGEKVSGGGRPSAARIVEQYQLEHPEARPKEIVAATGLSKSTVYKYYSVIGKGEGGSDCMKNNRANNG